MSLAAKFLTITLILIMPMDQQVYGRKIYAYFEALECSLYDTNYMETVKCWLDPDRSGQLTMNAVFKPKVDLTNIINRFRFIIEYNNRTMTFLSLDVDICSALGSAFKNPIIRLVSEEMRRISNLPIECPLMKGVEYVINKFAINSNLIPPFAPQLKWFAHSEFHTNTTDKKILHFVSSGRVVHAIPKTIRRS